MATKLFLRATTNNGVSGYKDMTTTAGSSVKSVTSNTTTAGGSEIPFTTGIWISGYTPAGGFTLTTTDVSVWQLESNMSANIGGRFRIYKRTLGGTETELGGSPFDDGVEMSTSIRENTWTGNVSDTAFAVNDRIVIKFFATNVGTMGAGYTASIQYDASDGSTGDSFFNIAETVTFTASPNTAPTVALNSPGDTDIVTDTTPDLTFTGTDADDDDIRYNVQLSTSPSFIGTLDSYDTEVSLFDGSIYGSAPTVNSRGQSFMGDGSNILSVAFYLKKGGLSGLPTGNAYALIYAHTGTFGSGGTPTGSVLATSNPIDVASLNSSYALTEFTFSTPFTTTASTPYFIVIEFTGGDNFNFLQVKGDLGATTPSGNGADRGASWVARFDYQFFVYIESTLYNEVSGTDSGFSGTPDNSDPFTSGQAVTYTVQSALDPDVYYWRVRGMDPTGSGTYGAWSDTYSFTVTSGEVVYVPRMGFINHQNPGIA